MIAQSDRIERQSGIAMWRQIADAIRAGLAGPLVDADGKLPPEKALAERFGVNRHTVRAAIRALAHEGAVESHQGRGTFVRRKPRLTYPIGQRTRFSEGLEGQASDRGAELIAQRRESATASVARALDITTGTPVICLESVGLADGVPVSRATSWFDAGRFGAIADVFARSRSVTRALAQLGVTDYVRAWTRIEARHGATGDLDHLRLSPGAIVLVAEAVNADLDGRPVQYAITRFAADRVSLQVGGD